MNDLDTSVSLAWKFFEQVLARGFRKGPRSQSDGLLLRCSWNIDDEGLSVVGLDSGSIEVTSDNGFLVASLSAESYIVAGSEDLIKAGWTVTQVDAPSCDDNPCDHAVIRASTAFRPSRAEDLAGLVAVTLSDVFHMLHPCFVETVQRSSQLTCFRPYPTQAADSRLWQSSGWFVDSQPMQYPETAEAFRAAVVQALTSRYLPAYRAHNDGCFLIPVGKIDLHVELADEEPGLLLWCELGNRIDRVTNVDYAIERLNQSHLAYKFSRNEGLLEIVRSVPVKPFVPALLREEIGDMAELIARVDAQFSAYTDCLLAPEH